MELFMNNRRKWDREKIEQATREMNDEIRKLIDDLRKRGEKVNYAEIGRSYKLSRERIRQIDEDR
jgi:DNA-directed RNA polymerase sigma subunit (sigma70/sigma32)